MRTFQPCVYLFANRYRGAIYTGVTTDLLARIYQHRTGAVSGFTEQHDVKRLVWFESHEDIEVAIRREKTIKRWRRQWKFNVIEQGNPEWRDLAVDFGFEPLGNSPLPLSPRPLRQAQDRLVPGPSLLRKRKLGPGTSPG